MFISIIIGIGLLTVLGLFFGLGLAIASQVFEVKVEEKVLKINSILPGVNCGACGFAGCAVYADAIVNKNAEINLCMPGGKKVVQEISDMLGIKADVKTKFVAKVFCLGDDAVAKKDYIFNGEEDCSTVHSFYNGEKACKYGCVGNGNCIRVCPVNAIKRDELNRVWIDAEICIGCEKCLKVCPPKVIRMVPENGGYFVACSSHDKGSLVKQNCKKGCIACKICEKVTGDPDRIYVEDNLAFVKYEKNTDLHPAAVKCPADVIVPIINQNLYVLNNKENKNEKKQSPV